MQIKSNYLNAIKIDDEEDTISKTTDYKSAKIRLNFTMLFRSLI